MKFVKKSAVIATAFSLIVLVLFSGCTTNPVIAQTSTPESTPTATLTCTPSPTLEPTPEPTPSPTHQPDLSQEEERALLGVKDINEVVDFSTILIMYYTQKDENGNEVKRIAWVTVSRDINENRGIYSRWGREKLYSIDSDATNDSEIVKSAIPANKRLADSKIEDTVGILGIRELYKNIGYKKIGYNNMGIDFELPEEMLSILALPGDEKEAYSLPMTAFMDLYIACTPKEYRTTWRDFDETLMPTTPAPTATVSPN